MAIFQEHFYIVTLTLDYNFKNTINSTVYTNIIFRPFSWFFF